VDLREFRPPSPEERAELRRRLSLPLDTPITLFLGRFARYKGIDDLLSAWSVVSENGLLVLAGTGDDTHGGIGKVIPGKRIDVRSWTNRPAEYLKACDIFVYPSHADGMSNALLEAMACGMAPIATAHGATEEMLTHETNALLVAPHDPRSLAEALNNLLRDSNQRSTISTQALETAHRYSITTVINQIEDVYYRVSSSPDSKSSVLSVGRADVRGGE
jgi:glycosyltransferase involved in cell wall biosynthesis